MPKTKDILFQTNFGEEKALSMVFSVQLKVLIIGFSKG
jgi:hypothetical protein